MHTFFYRALNLLQQSIHPVPAQEAIDALLVMGPVENSPPETFQVALIHGAPTFLSTLAGKCILQRSENHPRFPSSLPV